MGFVGWYFITLLQSNTLNCWCECSQCSVQWHNTSDNIPTSSSPLISLKTPNNKWTVSNWMSFNKYKLIKFQSLRVNDHICGQTIVSSILPLLFPCCREVLSFFYSRNGNRCLFWREWQNAQSMFYLFVFD